MNGGPFKPRRRRMGIHFRLGLDEPGFIIGGGFIADCYTGPLWECSLNSPSDSSVQSGGNLT